MSRTFTILAGLLSILLVTTFGVGWWYRFTFAQTPAGDGDVYLAHFCLGLGTAIVGLLVHCLIFTYFLGTGRWVKEVGIAYKLNDAIYPRETRELKRRVFPPALYAMLILIAAAAAGAGAGNQVWPWFVHAALGILALMINFWAFRIEWECLTRNAQILVAVLDEVDRIRAEQGLASNAEALAEEG